MSLLRASLRFLPFLILSAACTGKRADPTPSPNPPSSDGSGGAGGGGAAPSTGGNGGAPGGAPSTGGMGGTPSTGGMGGTPATGGAPGVGGSTNLNEAADIYPFCGCMADAQVNGACTNCLAGAMCANEQADCVGQCPTIVTALRACTFDDLACYSAAFNLDPDVFDDAVSLIQCECTGCADPLCDGTACGG